VGKLLFFTAVCGDAEGVGMGTIGLLAELQAVNINNPNKQYNRNIHVFFISHHWSLIQFPKQRAQNTRNYKNIIAPNFK
jgi:hypothetical protein